MEKSNNVDNFVAFPVSNPAFLIKDKATGSIIAATVCSPINDDIIAEMATNPNAIFQVLLPVILTIANANLLSKPW